MVIIIPARNEAGTIGELVKRASRYGTVLVVDDASTDNTAEVAYDTGDCLVLTNEKRMHIARSIQNGMRHAAQRLGRSGIITMDAGGSHAPEQIPDLVKEYDLVVGARTRYKAPIHRQLLSFFGTWIINKTLGTRMSDCTSGFRFYSWRAVKLLSECELVSTSYDWQIESIARLRKEGMFITEVPIKYKFTNSHLKLRDILRAIRTCWRMR